MRSLVRLAVAIAVLLALGGLCLAQQEATPIEGTVTFRDGRTITGEIKVAELGVASGSGIGSLLPGGGYFAVKVGDVTQKISAADLAMMEAKWENTGSEEQPNWVITQLSVTARDGTQYLGAPAWPPVHASSVEIGPEQVYAFPLAGVDFSPDNFLVKIDLTGGEPVPEAPAPPEPAPTEPETAPPAEVPAPTTPETPAEAVTVETPPGPVPVAPAPTAPEVVTTVVAPTEVGVSSTVLVIKCPECGKEMRIEIKVTTTDDQ